MSNQVKQLVKEAVSRRSSKKAAIEFIGDRLENSSDDIDAVKAAAKKKGFSDKHIAHAIDHHMGTTTSK